MYSLLLRLFSPSDGTGIAKLLDNGSGECYLCAKSVELCMVDCPACRGKKRAHTNNERCFKERCEGHAWDELQSYFVRNNMEDELLLLSEYKGGFFTLKKGLLESSVKPGTGYTPIDVGGDKETQEVSEEAVVPELRRRAREKHAPVEPRPYPAPGSMPGRSTDAPVRPTTDEGVAATPKRDLGGAFEEASRDVVMDDFEGMQVPSAPPRPDPFHAMPAASVVMQVASGGATPVAVPFAAGAKSLKAHAKRLSPVINNDGTHVVTATPFGTAALYIDLGPKEGNGDAKCLKAATAVKKHVVSRIINTKDKAAQEDVLPLACATRVVSVNSEEARLDPLALKAIADKRQNLLSRSVYNENNPVEWDGVETSQPDAKLLRIHVILGVKNEELDAVFRKWKARIVANGGNVRSTTGESVSGEFWYTLPMSLCTLRTLAGMSLPRVDHEIYSFDVAGAFLQAPRPEAPTYASLPPVLQTESMKRFKIPVVRLQRMLYGKIEAGDYWTVYLRRRLKEQGWREVFAAGGETVFEREGMLLGFYVDDGAAIGPKGKVLTVLSEVRSVIETSEPDVMQHFLGINFRRARFEGNSCLIMEQTKYAAHVLERFVAECGGPPRASKTPCYTDAELEQVENGAEAGAFRVSCRSHVGAFLFLGRGARPDLSYAVAQVARKVADWKKEDDARLRRLFGYLLAALQLGVVQQVAIGADGAGKVEVCLHIDADLAGYYETARSTSGWATFLAGTPGQRLRALVDLESKRQSVAARSSTESEANAGVEGLTRSGLPVLDLVAQTFGSANVSLVTRVGNDAMRRPAVTGASGALKYLRRYLQTNLGFLRDVFGSALHEEFRSIVRCATDESYADGFTKVFNGPGMQKVREQLTLAFVTDFEAYMTEGQMKITNAGHSAHFGEATSATVRCCRRAARRALLDPELRASRISFVPWCVLAWAVHLGWRSMNVSCLRLQSEMRRRAFSHVEFLRRAAVGKPNF